MILVLHPNEEQFKVLNNYENKTSRLQFTLDGFGRYIVGLHVLTHPNFAEIYDQLNELERIEFTPFPDETN